MRIVIVFVGPIKIMARLFKTIDTLTAAGHECRLIHGRVEREPPDYSGFPIPVESLWVSQDRWKPLTFASQILFGLRAGRRAVRARPQALVCINLVPLLAGIIVKRRLGEAVTFVYDSTELGLDMIPSALKRRLWGPIYRRGLREADAMVHASPERRELMIEKYAPPGRPYVVCNYPRYRPPFCRRPAPPPLRAIYLGILMRDRFCVEMLKAFADMNDPAVEFDLIGFYGREDYRQEIEAAAKQPTQTKIRVLPPIPQSKVLDQLADYHIGIAFYETNNPNEYHCAPNKLYDYISAQVAVLGSGQPALRKIIEAHRIGVCIDRVTPDAIRGAVEAIRAGRMWENITEDLRRRYCWESQENEWLAAIGAGPTEAEPT